MFYGLPYSTVSLSYWLFSYLARCCCGSLFSVIFNAGVCIPVLCWCCISISWIKVVLLNQLQVFRESNFSATDDDQMFAGSKAARVSVFVDLIVMLSCRFVHYLLQVLSSNLSEWRIMISRLFNRCLCLVHLAFLTPQLWTMQIIFTLHFCPVFLAFFVLHCYLYSYSAIVLCHSYIWVIS